MNNNLEHYTDDFYKMHNPWREDYGYISDWINKNIKGDIFGDIGCGNGYILQDLYNKYHKQVWGVDGSEHFMDNVDKSIRSMVRRLDLTEKLKLSSADVAICLEVVEHISEEFADILIDNIVSVGAKTIVFTAAPIGQEGVDHINLQHPEYWIDKFEKKGYYLNITLSEKFRTDLSDKLIYTRWYLNNWMILEKKPFLSKEELIKNKKNNETYLNISHNYKIEEKLLSTTENLRKNLDDLYTTKSQLDTTKSQLDTTKSQLDTTKSQLDTTKSQLDLKVNELNTIYYSRGWRFIIYIRKLLNYFIPRESLRRRISSFLYNFSKRGVKLVLKIRSKIFSLFLKTKNYFNKPKSYKRKINRDSKKIVYVGHSYHSKTKSTNFLIKYLKEYFDVQIILDESWIGKPFPDLSFIDESYLGVVFFQLLPSKDILKSIKNDNIIYIPMYDDSGGFSFEFWNNYLNIKIINFSKTLHDKLQKWGLDTIYVQYFPKPDEFIPGNNKEIFFWQRLTHVNINTIAKLFGKNKYRIHLHKVVDPGQEFIEPNTDIKKRFNIDYSEWFEDKKDLIDLISQKGIYVAPREYEGIGMSFLEAMAMGKAVVAVDNPTMNEYITDGQNGYLFNLKNPKEINLSNIDEVQKNSYEFIKKGNKKWEKNKNKIINFIKN